MPFLAPQYAVPQLASPACVHSTPRHRLSGSEWLLFVVRTVPLTILVIFFVSDENIKNIIFVHNLLPYSHSLCDHFPGLGWANLLKHANSAYPYQII